MSDVLANSIVAIAIVVSACYSVWRLGPARMRIAVRTRLSKAFPRVFGSLTVDSTGACDACGGCAPAASRSRRARKEHTLHWRKKTARS